MFVINDIWWEVFLVSPSHPVLIKPNGDSAIGVCDKNKRKIYILNSLSFIELKQVLCHEIVHAAMFSYNITLTYVEEEFIANLITQFGEEIIDITNSIFSQLVNK